MDEQRLITALIEENIKQTPISMKKMNLGFINMVYDVEFPGKEIIIRINHDKNNFIGVEQNIEKLKELGLPVSNILYIDLSKKKYDVAYMIMEKIPGRDLRYEIENMSKEQMTNIADKIIFYQNKVGKLCLGKGFGRCNIGEKGKYESWTEFIKDEVNKVKESIDLEIYNKIITIMYEFKVYFDSVSPTCFLDDITLKNVIIKEGKLEGLIDFDWVCYGDPLYTIALVQTGTMVHLNDKCMYYVEELCKFWNVTDFQRKVIDFYSLIHAAKFVNFQLKMNNKYLIKVLNDKINVLIKRM
ncbi:phosphotransferase [Clostridium aestuarii]|uniref:Phosphotransferase n=1 Tax=Clostridium aestuarii TaxID=338193 RepID=A0ABT4D3G6_9CLOT|nr:phosphotransferase [Clostridium aestuarii]MCY6485182.1 phosphotransferase [Clostridium aestuarii]